MSISIGSNNHTYIMYCRAVEDIILTATAEHDHNLKLRLKFKNLKMTEGSFFRDVRTNFDLSEISHIGTLSGEKLIATNS